MRTLKLVLERPASRSRSANQKPPTPTGKTHDVPWLTGQTQAGHEVGSRFELLKITRCHWLVVMAVVSSPCLFILFVLKELCFIALNVSISIDLSPMKVISKTECLYTRPAICLGLAVGFNFNKNSGEGRRGGYAPSPEIFF